MMAREYGAFHVGIWQDEDWRNLPAPAQHLYMLLTTNPTLSYCGVADWRPSRLTPLAQGLDRDSLGMIADCLQARHYIVTDEDTEEVLVRSWVRWDGLMRKPRMAISVIKAYAEVASNKLRPVIVHELQRLRDEEPELSCWKDSRVLELLAKTATSARDLPTPSDPFAGGFTYDLRSVCDPFAANVTSGLRSVCDPPTPYSLLHAPSSPLHVGDVPDEHEADGELELLPETTQKGKRKTPARPLPDDWTPTDTHAVYCRNNGLDLDLEAEKFRSHAGMKDRRLANWNLGFTNWLNSAKGYQQATPARRGQTVKYVTPPPPANPKPNPFRLAGLFEDESAS